MLYNIKQVKRLKIRNQRVDGSSPFVSRKSCKKAGFFCFKGEFLKSDNPNRPPKRSKKNKLTKF